MDTIKNIETLGRKAWLAGIGVYGTTWKYAVDKFDSTYAKTNEFVNELISEGEKVEKELQEKLQARDIIDSRVTELKNKLGLNEASDVERIEQLNAKVDNLIAKVAQLAETQEVKALTKEKAPVKKAAAKPKATTKKVVAAKPETK